MYDYEQIQRNDIEINQIDIELPPLSSIEPNSTSRLRKSALPRLEKMSKDYVIPVSDHDLIGRH
jgi:hypothetical protein